MATEGQQIKFSFVSTNDLSTKQFYFVKLSADRTIVLCNGATDKPIGVLQNKPTAGQQAEVTLAGVTKVSAAASNSAGNLIGTDANGQGAAYVPGTDTTKYIVGSILSPAGAASGICTAVINCMSLSRGA